MTPLTKISWHRAMAKENQTITNYVLNAEGTWKGKIVKGKGTIKRDRDEKRKKIRKHNC